MNIIFAVGVWANDVSSVSWMLKRACIKFSWIVKNSWFGFRRNLTFFFSRNCLSYMFEFASQLLNSHGRWHRIVHHCLPCCDVRATENVIIFKHDWNFVTSHQISFILSFFGLSDARWMMNEPFNNESYWIVNGMHNNVKKNFFAHIINFALTWCIHFFAWVPPAECTRRIPLFFLSNQLFTVTKWRVLSQWTLSHTFQALSQIFNLIRNV